ncbi:internal (core) protein [Pseudomonas phage vB_PaeM_FBPa24]|nr:internal (core) protein [Pseudomonas phage vB_PaeM_FBPa24]
MSSDLDEFILRYEADTARAERNLERLQNQIRRVNSASTSGLQDLRHFADGAATELGRVVPQIDSVTSAIRGMNAQLAIGATGVALVAAGVKAFMNTRDQYNQQRIQAMDIGIAPARLEEYQRKFVRQSGGTISREQGAEMTKNLADTFRRAYRDIGRVGPEARILRMAGVDVGSFQKGMRPLNDIITDLATKMAKLKPDEISAYADALGVSRDYLSTLAKIGPAMGKVTEMTTAELQSRVQGESNIQKFNDALANLNQTFTTLENRVGEKLAPAFTKLIEIIDKIVQAIPNEVESFAKDTKSRWEDGVLGKATVGSDILSLLSPGALLGRLAAWGTRRGMEESGLIDKDKVPGAQTSEDLAEKQEDQDKATKSMKELEKLADQTTKSTNDFAVAINMFSGAVSSFANAVDERQAWAAWAGEIGRAVGMGSTAPTSRATGVYPHAIYDQSKSGAAGQVFGEPIGAQSLRNRMFSPQRKAEPVTVPSYINDIIKDASKMYNIPELDIKKLIYTESRFNARATSEAGAKGLMQLMPEIAKAYGITDVYDPRQNILGGTRLLREKAMTVANETFAPEGGDMDIRPYDGGRLETPDQGKKEDERREARRYDDRVVRPEIRIIDRMPDRSDGEILKMSRRQEADRADSGFRKFPNQVRGETKQNIQAQLTAGAIAQVIGVNPNQIMRREISRSDLLFGYNQAILGKQQEIKAAATEANNVFLSPAKLAEATAKVNAASREMDILRTYGEQLLKSAPERGQELTIGRIDMLVNVTGANSPEEAREIFSKQTADQLTTAIQDAQNDSATKILY